MSPEEREQMHALCKRIAEEKKHDQFLKLVQELNELMSRKENRLETNPGKGAGAAQDSGYSRSPSE